MSEATSQFSSSSGSPIGGGFTGETFVGGRDFFHEVRFPIFISLGMVGGPEYITEVIHNKQGYERRRSLTLLSRHRYQLSYGMHSFSDVYKVVEFFHQRRGRLYGFRFFDKLDSSSSRYGETPSFKDQPLGFGDGVKCDFQLVKNYGSLSNISGDSARIRKIFKPVEGSTKVALSGKEVQNWSIDTSTGVVNFLEPPRFGSLITAGFSFDVPVRFDMDYLEIDRAQFSSGKIPEISLIECMF